MRVYRSGNMVRVESPTLSANDTDSFASCELKRVRLGLTGLTIQDGSNNVLVRIGEYNTLDANNNIQDGAGGAFITLNDALVYLDSVLCFEVGGGGITSINQERQFFNATAGQTAIALTQIPVNPTQVEFFVNGDKQIFSLDFTIAGTSLTWLDRDFVLTINDEIEIIYFY